MLNNQETKKAESPLSVSVTSPGPIVNELDERTAASFPTGRLMEDHPDYIQCKHCKRPVPKGVAESHTTICIKQKREKAKRKKEAKEAAQRAKDAKEKGTDKDGDMKVEDAVVAKANGEDGENLGEKPSSARKGVVKGAADEGTKKGKKRKLDGEGDKEPKKKKLKKDEPKIKVPKPKGPVDVEKQCGVPLPNGAQCARSLTCKSHSMGAKRAVPGRSLPYDMLLQAYQKKNQAKQQSMLHSIPHLVCCDLCLRLTIEQKLQSMPMLPYKMTSIRTPVLWIPTRKKIPSWPPSHDPVRSLLSNMSLLIRGENISTYG